MYGLLPATLLHDDVLFAKGKAEDSAVNTMRRCHCGGRLTSFLAGACSMLAASHPAWNFLLLSQCMPHNFLLQSPL